VCDHDIVGDIVALRHLLEQFVHLAEAVTFGVEIQLQQRVVDEHCESVDLAAESGITDACGHGEHIGKQVQRFPEQALLMVL
jgi:hypothetical protein